MKPSRIFVACAVVTLFFAFQNCSQVNFESTDPLEMGSNESGRILEFKAETMLVPQDLKVILVVDDSYTMQQSQQYLSEKIQSLLESFRERNVEILLTTTSDANLRRDAKYKVRQDGGSRIDLNNLPLLKEIDETQIPMNMGFEYIISQEYGALAVATYKFTSTMTQNEFAAMSSTISNKVKSLGTNGSDEEKGICPVLRILKDKSATSFIKDGDRVGVIIISDEDDNSQICSTESFLKYSRAGRTANYQIQQKVASVKYGVDQHRDGIYIGTVYSSVYLPAANTYWVEGNKCSSADLQQYASSYNTIVECVYKSFKQAYNFYELEIGAAIDKNLCSTAFTYKGESHNNLLDYFLKRNPSSPGNITCVYSGVDSNLETQMFIERKDESLVSAGVAVSLLKAANERLKNNFFVSVIFHKTSGTCQLLTGQKIGKVYEQLGALFGNSSYLHSICENNYAEPLAQVSGFVKKVNSVLKIPTLPTEVVTRVSIRNATGEFVLPAEQFHYSNGVLTVDSDKLNENSMVRVFLSQK